MKNKGFTLIELLVVIAIIVIIIAIAIPSYIQYIKTSAQGVALQDARECLEDVYLKNVAVNTLAMSGHTVDPTFSSICSISTDSNTMACTCTYVKAVATAIGTCKAYSLAPVCTVS